MLKKIIVLLIILNASVMFASEVTFKWKAAQWAKHYKIQIARDSNFYKIRYEFDRIGDDLKQFGAV